MIIKALSNLVTWTVLAPYPWEIPKGGSWSKCFYCLKVTLQGIRRTQVSPCNARERDCEPLDDWHQPVIQFHITDLKAGTWKWRQVTPVAGWTAHVGSAQSLSLSPCCRSRDWISPRLLLLHPGCVWIEKLFIYRCEISCVEREELFKKQTTEQKSRSSFLVVVSIQAFFFPVMFSSPSLINLQKTNASVSEPDTKTPCML